MNTLTYQVPSMHCQHCVHTIESELAELEGVKEVSADLTTRQVTVTFDAPADDTRIRALLAEINYPAEGKNV